MLTFQMCQEYGVFIFASVSRRIFRSATRNFDLKNATQSSVAFRVLSLYSLPLICPEDGMMRRALLIAVTGPEGCRPCHGHNDQMRRKLSRAVTA